MTELGQLKFNLDGNLLGEIEASQKEEFNRLLIGLRQLLNEREIGGAYRAGMVGTMYPKDYLSVLAVLVGFREAKNKKEKNLVQKWSEKIRQLNGGEINAVELFDLMVDEQKK